MTDKDTDASSITENQQSDLAKRVLSIKWFHHIYIPGYGLTPGPVRNSQDWLSSNLPKSFNGLRVLDIGGWDGYYSFLAEERGAVRILMIDSLQNPEAHSSGTLGFELAKETRKSKVEFKLMDVQDLDDLSEQFDVVFFLGVYYHLIDPIGALSKIFDKLAENGVVYLEGISARGRKPSLRFFEVGEIEPTTFCAGTERGLIRILENVGFSNISVIAKTRDPGRIISWVYSKVNRSGRFIKLVSGGARNLGFISDYPRILISAKKNSM